MNIYLQELKMKIGSIITWSISIAGLILLFFSIFSTMADEMELLNEVMSNYPPELLAAFGWDQMDLGIGTRYLCLHLLLHPDHDLPASRQLRLLAGFRRRT